MPTRGQPLTRPSTRSESGHPDPLLGSDAYQLAGLGVCLTGCSRSQCPKLCGQCSGWTGQRKSVLCARGRTHRAQRGMCPREVLEEHAPLWCGTGAVAWRAWPGGGTAADRAQGDPWGMEMFHVSYSGGYRLRMPVSQLIQPHVSKGELYVCKLHRN